MINETTQKKENPCEYAKKTPCGGRCHGANENCFYGDRLEINESGNAEGCTFHDDWEIMELESYLQTMQNYTTEEAISTHNKKAARYKELTGKDFVPKIK